MNDLVTERTSGAPDNSMLNFMQNTTCADHFLKLNDSEKLMAI